MATKRRMFAKTNLRAKPKTNPELSQTLPLPVNDPASGVFPINAVFTGYSVNVTSPDAIRILCLNGGFGQGMLSRAFPRACITNSREPLRKKKRAVHVPEQASPSNTSDPNYSSSSEPLCLFLEEAFFLMHTLGILELKNVLGEPITIPEAFERFRKVKKNFLSCYCAYLYLKSKNWIIKSGIKFGGDFVIYVKGPQFYHASYIVLIQERFEGNQLNAHIVNGLDFQAFNRIAETTAKDILFLEVHYPRTYDLTVTGDCLQRLKDVRVAEICTKHHNYLAARNQ